MSGRAHRTARPRVGLALPGGGPLGGIYEIGALLALTGSLDGVDLNSSTSTSAFHRAALPRRRWLTAFRRRRCTDCSSTMQAPTVRRAARDLAYTLDQLERWLHRSRRLPRRVRAAP